MPVEVVDRGMQAYLARLRDLEDLEVVAGHVGANSQEPHPKSKGVTKLQVSRFVHYGTPHMPARPYTDLATAELQASSELDKVFMRLLKAQRRTTTPAAVGLRAVGKIYAKAVRDAIVAVDAVDTGATRDAVRYQVRLVRGGFAVEEGDYRG